MILERSLRRAVLSTITVALLTATVWAKPEFAGPAQSVRGQKLHGEMAANRPAMRTQSSQGEWRTKIPVAKQVCAPPASFGFAQALLDAGSQFQSVNRAVSQFSRSFNSSRAPPLA